MGGDSGDVVSHCRLPAIVGDQLWVREAWRTFISLDAMKPADLWPRDGKGAGVAYEAGGGMSLSAGGERYGDCGLVTRADIAAFGKLRTPIFMPRWASRITLTVTEVRVQRVGDISEADAEAEGMKPTTCANVVYEGDGFPSYKSAFGIAWNSIHGPDAWRRNDWVAAISFEVRKGNIDASMKGAA